MSIIATIERMLWFDEQVKSGSYPNARKLAEKFEISDKTARRCIDAMRDRFYAPLEYDPVRRGYFYTEKTPWLPDLGIRQEEVLSLMLARDLLSDTAEGMIGIAVGRFAEKLIDRTRTAGLPGRRVNQLFSSAFTGHEPVSRISFRQAVHCLLFSRRLHFRYLSPGRNQTTRRDVEPHHLQYYMGSWVLIAFCRMRRGWRKFYLSRMAGLRPLPETFVRRPENEWKRLLDRAYGVFQGGEEVEVVLRFTPFRARWVKEQVWHPDQILRTMVDGGIEMRVPVSDFREIKMKILSFGADVAVISPKTLKQEIAREVEKMVRIHAG